MEENRKRQKRQLKKRKSITFFIAALFTILIGQTMVWYFLGGRELIAEHYLPVGKRILFVAFLLAAMAFIYHVIKHKYIKLICYVLLVIVTLAAAYDCAGIKEEKALKPEILSFSENDCKGYEINDSHFRVNSAYAKIKKDINVSYLDNLIIHFSSPVAQDMKIRLRYTTKKRPEFDKKIKIVIPVEAGSTDVEIPVKVDQVRKIKLSIGVRISNEFDLDSIEINGNYQERIEKKFLYMIMISLIFLAFPLCYILLSIHGKTEQCLENNIIMKILTVLFGPISILSLFLAFLAKYMVLWVQNNCGNVSFSIIVLQMTSPIKGADSDIVSSIIKTGVVPAILLTLTIVLFYLFITRFMFYSGNLPSKKIPRWGKLLVEVVLIVFLCFTVKEEGTNIGMWDYLKAIQESSTLYEDHYVDPAKTEITFPDQKRNLIYIYMESMENTFSDRDHGGTMTSNLIPNLTELAGNNISFSSQPAGTLGGPTCLEATAFTAGGLVAQTSGIHLTVENTGSMFGDFLPGLTSLGDILDSEGYQQVFLCGSDGDFAGRDNYFKSHKNFKIEDYNSAKEEGYIAENYKVFWGHEDEILYERAKDQLLELSESDQPFNFTMLTVDTHFPKGYKCNLCKDTYDTQYANAIACADQQVSDFIKWIQEQDFYENTTIIIAGDHTSMTDTNDPFWTDMEQGYQRTVYNVILNSKTEATEERTSNRNFSTMDMFPTTLSSLGVQIKGDRLGLGTDLFSSTPTLSEELGKDYLNQELLKNDVMYNHFYQ